MPMLAEQLSQPTVEQRINNGYTGGCVSEETLGLGRLLFASFGSSRMRTPYQTTDRSLRNFARIFAYLWATLMPEKFFNSDALCVRALEDYGRMLHNMQFAVDSWIFGLCWGVGGWWSMLQGDYVPRCI